MPREGHSGSRQRAHSAAVHPTHDSIARAPRRSSGSPPDEIRRQFVALSVVLTGFDDAELWGTGMVDPYLDWLRSVVGDQRTGELLSASQEAIDAAGGNRAKLERLFLLNIFEDDMLGALARNLVVLWYLGQWNQLPADWRDTHGATALDQTCIVSPDAYTEGLAWKAIHAHPQGAKMQGYGAWALPPVGAEEDS